MSFCRHNKDHNKISAIRDHYHGMNGLYHGIVDQYGGFGDYYHGIRDYYHGIEYQYHGILHRLTADCSYTAKNSEKIAKEKDKKIKQFVFKKHVYLLASSSPRSINMAWWMKSSEAPF